MVYIYKTLVSNQLLFILLLVSVLYFLLKLSSPNLTRSTTTLTPVILHDYNFGFERTCSDISNTSSDLIQQICHIEQSKLTPLHSRTVLVRDTSRIRYYAQRDLQGWQMFYENIGYKVVEPRFSLTPPDPCLYDVLLCMGLVLQDQSCVSPQDYPRLAPGQRVSQFYGMRQVLWRKDSFCRTMKSVFARIPKRVSTDFLFDCWVLPNDLEDLRGVMHGEPDGLWIAKPRSRGEGKGIMIVHNLAELYEYNLLGSVIQPYLDRVMLIEGRKFDLRTYVLVTSINPLRAYFYKEGLVRLASELYNKTGNSKTQFLTNTSVGKLVANINDIVWMYKDLIKYLRKMNFDGDLLFERVEEVIVKTLLAGEVGFHKLYQDTFPGYMCENCYQLLGVDVIIDEDLNPKVIEINGIPSMQLSHDLGVKPDPSKPYTATKFGLLRDTLNTLYQPNTRPHQLERMIDKLGIGIVPSTCEEQHQFCVTNREFAFLVDSQREFFSKGMYKRIYPTQNGDLYTDLLTHTHKTIMKTADDKNQLTTYKLHHLMTLIEIYNLQNH
ncbi:hypothetical protein LOD99_1667 [Oopsacas minuta]|uniref:Uncharacterized protein n=1 Tax=Oopsacas minuta TaxID=111878 RepID=A0AAV7K3X8_9METZ|nr:hypothetical protein LOD99_1667 [Oopsacas minuta]